MKRSPSPAHSRSYPRFVVFLLALALALAASWAGSARSQSRFDGEIEEREAELEDLKRQAQAKRKAARSIATKERGALAMLNQAEEALAATRAYIRKLEQRQEEVNAQIREMGVVLEKSEETLSQQRAVLAERLRHSYIYGKVRTLEVVFSSASFPDLLQRGAFLSRILNQDQRLINEVEGRQSEITEKMSWLELKKEELSRLQSETKDEEEQHAVLKADREAQLNKLRRQRTAHEKAAKELERAAVQMEQVLGELERRRKEAMSRDSQVLAELDRKNFGSNRGKLPWPVTGKVITSFGRHVHPKYKTVTMSKGVDIAAPVGRTVSSVADGVVDLVQWLPGYGQTVIINHGKGFYTVYSHLSTVAVSAGSRVLPSQALGAVGETGSLKGPCLHFEVRSEGQPQDPLAWLRR